MSGRFKVRCIYARGASCYTKDKIYDISNGCIMNDFGDIALVGLKSLEDLQEKSSARWELVEEKENNMVNFKARCIDTKEMHCYTRGKVYDIINNTLISDFGNKYFTGKINSFKDLERWSFAKWELVEENTKNLSLTITSKKATISDGECTFEIDRDCYKNERDMIDNLLDKYYSEKNKIKVGDTVKVVDNNYQYKTYSGFIFDNAEELQKQMSATEFAKLILNFKKGEVISEKANTYKVNLVNKLLNLPSSDTKIAIISNDIYTFIVDTRGLEKVKER